MRIYSKKTYIVLVEKSGIGLVLTGEELRMWVAGGSLENRDRVYEAQLFAVAREKREIELVDASGHQVEQSEIECSEG